MITALHARRAVILGAPLLLIVFSLAHGIDWVVMHGVHDKDYDAFLHYIVDTRGRWLAVHVAGLGVFPLLGIAIWWMVRPGRLASMVSKVGLTLYIVLYTAFDAVAGIGGAVVADYRQGLPAAEQQTMDGVIWSLMGDADATYYLAGGGTFGWLIGTMAAAMVLWQEHGWRVGLPLAIGGLIFCESHFPPYGAAAGAFLSIAAWQFVNGSSAPRLSTERETVSEHQIHTGL